MTLLAAALMPALLALHVSPGEVHAFPLDEYRVIVAYPPEPSVPQQEAEHLGGTFGVAGSFHWRARPVDTVITRGVIRQGQWPRAKRAALWVRKSYSLRCTDYVGILNSPAPQGQVGIGYEIPPDAEYALRAGPMLVQDGENIVAEAVKRERFRADVTSGRRMRNCVGLRPVPESGATVPTAGAQEIVFARGVASLDAMARLFVLLRCHSATNLDGGSSCQPGVRVPVSVVILPR